MIANLDVDLAPAGLAELILDDLIGWCRAAASLWHVTPTRWWWARPPPPGCCSGIQGALLDAIDALALSGARSPARRSTSGRPSGRSARHTAPDAAPRPPCLLTTTWTHSARLYRPFRGVPSPSARPPRWPGLSESFLEVIRAFSCPGRPNVPGDGSRSGRRFVQTSRLANAGATADQAWALISAISGGKSARRGRSWWERYVWSRVRAPQAANGFDLSALVLPVMAASRPLYAALDTRSRHSLETVLMAILERLDRTSQRPVPLSERDLVLATGLSRPTIRAAGVRAVQLGILTRTRDARQDAAWVWALAERSATASLTCPSILTPRPSRWLHGCPAGSATALLDHHLAGPPGRQPSTRQAALRSAQLDALRKHHALPGVPRPRPTAATTDGWHARLAQVTAERDQFYAGIRAAREARQAPYHRRILARRQRPARLVARAEPSRAGRPSRHLPRPARPARRRRSPRSHRPPTRPAPASPTTHPTAPDGRRTDRSAYSHGWANPVPS